MARITASHRRRHLYSLLICPGRRTQPLAEFALAPSEEGPETEALTTEEELPAPEGPDWLAELQTDLEETEPLGEEMLAEAEAADWLVPSEPGWEDEEGLVPAEIPAWLLALKPAELREEEEAEEPVADSREPMEETGILAGLQGTLPVEMVFSSMTKLEIFGQMNWNCKCPPTPAHLSRLYIF